QVSDYRGRIGCRWTLRPSCILYYRKIDHMDFIKVNVDERISHVYLDRGKSNAIDRQMLEELRQVIADAQADPAVEGLILHGKEGFFSAGLDLVALYEYNADEVREFWQTFIDFVRTFVAFDKPA